MPTSEPAGTQHGHLPGVVVVEPVEAGLGETDKVLVVDSAGPRDHDTARLVVVVQVLPQVLRVYTLNVIGRTKDRVRKRCS